MIITRCGNPAAAAATLAEQVVATLQKGVALRGTGSLAVPGGRTPLPLFQALKEAALDWSRIVVTLTDERWVPEADAASNAALVRDELLKGRAAVARFLPLYDGSPHAATAASGVWRTLQAVPRPIDAVVLGMGEDGHFASLFPGNSALPAALDPYAAPACVAMQAPQAPRERISLNLAALRQSRRLFLLVAGEAKRQVLLAAARGDPDEHPVAALLALRHPVPEVYWAP